MTAIVSFLCSVTLADLLGHVDGFEDGQEGARRHTGLLGRPKPTYDDEKEVPLRN